MNQAAQQSGFEQPETGGRVPPSDYQAEQAVLGAVLIDETAFAKVAEYVKRDSFYWSKHGVIFEALLNLFHRNEPTDLVTLHRELNSLGKLEEVGGDVYISELAEAVPFPRNVEYYARIVQDKYLLRKLSTISEDIGERVFDPAAEPAEVLEKSIEELFTLQKAGERAGYRDMRKVAHDTTDLLDKIYQRGGALTGVGSGFKALDEMTGGFQHSDLIVLAARPSMGKTALALCFAHNAARMHKIPVGVISLEMSASQIAMRLMSFESRVPLYRIRTAKFSDAEWERIAKASSTLSRLPIYIDDSASQTITDVRARARRLQLQNDVGMIILDYLQLMQPPARSESQQQAIAAISRQLKGLAKELEIPVIAISQLSRAVETRGGSKRPILSDLRDSGAIEQDADVVMFVYRQAYYDRLEGRESEQPNMAEVIIGKQRNGPTGTVRLAFLDDYALFANLEARIEEEETAPAEVDTGETPF
ncbi:MAG TPA: replicative DNA helicase [Bacteroidetes bacterium]|nr:replicative DNA helicase [Bacteroidota bacterium]